MLAALGLDQTQLCQVICGLQITDQKTQKEAEIRLRPFSPVALDTVVTIYLVMFTYT